MKKLMAITAIFLLSITWLFSQKNSRQGSGSQTSWDVSITPNTTMHQLDSLTMELKKYNAFLVFTRVEYNKQGKLIKITGSTHMYSPDGDLYNTFTKDSMVPFKISYNAANGSLSIRNE